MFLDPIGDCDECEKRAFFEYQDRTYCVRHSSAINGVDPDKVERIAGDLEDIDGVEEANRWPMAFIVVLPSGDEIPWAVHEVSDEHGYRMSDEELEEEVVVEPKNATVSYRNLEEFLSR